MTRDEVAFMSSSLQNFPLSSLILFSYFFVPLVVVYIHNYTTGEVEEGRGDEAEEQIYSGRRHHYSCRLHASAIA